MEEKQISSSTISTVSNDIDIQIYTFYDQNIVDCGGVYVTNLPYILQVFVSENPGFTGMVGYTEGQLIITANNFPQLVNCFIDNNGNLFIVGNDSAKYSINEDTGDLIYTLCDL